MVTALRYTQENCCLHDAIICFDATAALYTVSTEVPPALCSGHYCTTSSPLSTKHTHMHSQHYLLLQLLLPLLLIILTTTTGVRQVVGSDLPEADVQAMLYEVDPTAAASAAAAGRTFCVYYDMFVQFWRDQLNQRYGKSGSSIFDKVTRRAVTSRHL
jgi:hypothetical protein